MFILQDGNLHIQDKGGKIIGVNIHTDKIIPIKGTVADLKVKNHSELTAYEVKCRYNITEENPYMFPKPKVKKEVVKEVKSVEPTPKTKKSTGKSK